MERTHREKAVTSIQQGPHYVGARKKIPPLGANCPQTENHEVAPPQVRATTVSFLIHWFASPL